MTRNRIGGLGYYFASRPLLHSPEPNSWGDGADAYKLDKAHSLYCACINGTLLNLNEMMNSKNLRPRWSPCAEKAVEYSFV